MLKSPLEVKAPERPTQKSVPRRRPSIERVAAGEIEIGMEVTAVVVAAAAAYRKAVHPDKVSYIVHPGSGTDNPTARARAMSC